MGVIAITGIRVFAQHGVMPEEALIGGVFRVDIRIEGDLGRAEDTDALEATVDYGLVSDLVRQEMAVPSKLIEHVAKRILSRLRTAWPSGLNWTICVVKEFPPVGGQVQQVSYTVEG